MLRSISALLLSVILLWSCGSSNESAKVNDSRFTDYVDSHTSGLISRRDNIGFQFKETVTVPTDLALSDMLSISPSLKGTLVKTGNNAFTFSPEDLQSGVKYTFNIHMDKLMPMPKGLETYVFDVNVIAQDFEAEIGVAQMPDPSYPEQLEFEGKITTADFVENESVEKMVNIPDGLEITWQHPGATLHRFAVKGLKRGEQSRTLSFNVSGAPIGVKRSMDLKLDVPSTQVFSVISTKVELEKDGLISIFFTDPLDAQQNLEGLINIEGVSKIRPVISGNEIKVYIREKVSGSKKLEIFQGIKNNVGKSLQQNVITYVAFEPEKPQIKLSGNGTILPSTEGLVIPFEAVNLKAINVEVIKIFEENMPQFLQVNRLSGNSQIARVGRQVMSKKIDLSNKADNLSAWNRFTLDLTSLFETERGALYKIRLGFSPEDSNFPCDQVFQNSDNDDNENQWSIYDYDGFNEYGGGFQYRYPSGYEWRERNNPCHVSYYHSDKFVSTTLLATDLGLIAKIGGNNTMNVFATNMLNAQPVSATITILDYQLQELNTGQTDANGMVTFTPERRPFLIIAEADGQKSYLRLEDNESLSLSNFDVSGTKVRGNIKGFIYGERGVWRPGDDIFLSFLLEDPEDKLPSDHPIIMQLKDPRGNTKDRQVISNGVEGLYTVKTKTSQLDETGNWWVTFTVGNSSFTKTLKVETVKPNRLKIDLDLGDGIITPSENSISTSLNAKWLTGVKASNLKAETELKLSEMKTSFKGYNQYDFDDEAKSFYQDPKSVFSGQLSNEGSASINLKLPEKPNSPGAIRATFNTKVFEPGGGFSINTRTATYLPYNTFVGINLINDNRYNRIERDKPQELNVITLDANGKPISRNQLEFKLYRLDWRWWWESDDYNTNYTSSRYSHLVESKKITTQNDGKGKVNFQIKSPDWGRFIAVVKDLESGHSTSQIFYTSWYGSGDNNMGASSLEVSTNKDEYATGEKIQVTIRGSLSGQALISVENGSEVLQSKWIKTEKEWTTFELDATPEMAPNVYLHVTLLQPHGQTVNDLPIRLYGIASINVFDPNTKLEPVLQMADELAPESQVEIKISESQGKPMAYTIAMVDEGLLDLTNFKTPEPWSHFYTKEAIGVKTWDVYKDVIGAYGGRLERLLAIGGGDGGEGDDKKKDDNRFKPVVQFAGPFYLAAGETKAHTLQLPQYIGSVRTMVVAGIDGAYGNTEKATPVVKPLMILGTMPRVVGPGEKITMPVNVFRYKDHIKNANVTVETTGILKLTSAKSQSIALNEESGTLYFDIDVLNKLGKGKVIITATSGSETAKHEINITSRSPNTPQTITKVIAVEAGKSITPNQKVFGIDGSNEVSLELATIPPINLEQRIKYLIQYPHGCIEQTVSSVFPQLFLKNITELTTTEKVNIDNNIVAAIDRLKRFQISSGGLGYWPGSSHYSTWGTNYAFHFLTEAQKQGFLVPAGMVEQLKNFQANKARNWTKSVDYWDSDLIQAYRLFTLALSGNPEIGAMNRLRNTSDLSLESIHKLAAAYAIIGQKEAAESLMKGHGRTNMKERSFSYYSYNYGSFTRDLAMLLETFVYMDNKTESYKILQELSEHLSDERWMSTQTTAYSLLAVSKYIAANAANEGISAQISYGGKTTNWASKKVVYKASIPVDAVESLSVKNQGNATLFATVTISGIPEAGKEPIHSENLNMNVRYVNSNGRTIQPDSIAMGESFDVIVTLKNEYSYGLVRDLALAHIMPSGWEIQNDRLNDQESEGSSGFTYQDIRDDRVYTYFNLSSGETKVFKTTVTAAYPGKYYLPGPHAEAMYKSSITAKNAGKWVYVYKK